jgi:hypothetical protein
LDIAASIAQAHIVTRARVEDVVARAHGAAVADRAVLAMDPHDAVATARDATPAAQSGTVAYHAQGVAAVYT